MFTSLTSGTAGQDCNGHGTAVAASVGGLTYGPAKNVTLLAVRSLECLGNGTVAQVIQGLDWVKDNFVPPAVVVMALGGELLRTICTIIILTGVASLTNVDVICMSR